MKRSQPLVDVESQQREAEEQFNKTWESGNMDEWQDSRYSQVASGENGENGENGIWCSACKFIASCLYIPLLLAIF